MPDSGFERAAETLLLNAELAIVLFNFSPDAIIVVGEDGRVQLANRQAELITGWPRSALQGLDVDQLVPEPLRPGHCGHRGDYMEDPRLRPMGAHLDLQLRRRNGSRVAVDINLSPVATSKGMFVIATIRRKGAGLASPPDGG